MNCCLYKTLYSLPGLGVVFVPDLSGSPQSSDVVDVGTSKANKTFSHLCRNNAENIEYYVFPYRKRYKFCT